MTHFEAGKKHFRSDLSNHRAHSAQRAGTSQKGAKNVLN
ncbi:hypothetical protein Cabys_763 [Caldithrix abyssi DSM 13497]|uniref:Uncharacterized protein n=1 Tax=Caldithrix abyssi DSM 13497 TaxID=880073 RepID=A0A1J1C679_CALAY|nr:hypothetical protein Cabys_763 [Caldithrix abyssi DSM 13497]